MLQENQVFSLNNLTLKDKSITLNCNRNMIIILLPHKNMQKKIYLFPNY